MHMALRNVFSTKPSNLYQTPPPLKEKHVPRKIPSCATGMMPLH